MKILLVEDHPAVAEMTVQVLRKMHGHEVEYAADGTEALRTLDAFEPDLALIDIGLPGMNGYDLARLLRERYPERGPVLVALTGYAQAEDHDRALDAGFDHHFGKPMDFDTLPGLASTRA